MPLPQLTTRRVVESNAYTTTASTSVTMAGSNLVWRVWNTPTAATGGYTNASNTDYIWCQWTGAAATTVSTSGTITIWDAWTNAHDAQQVVRAQQSAYRKPSAEQLAEWKARDERLRAEADERQRKAKEARGRAERLLLDHLTAEQREDLQKKNCFYLESVGKDGQRRKYRIDRGTHGNVKLLGPDGRPVGQYCVQPNNVPVEDAMLAQKLWLETDEEAFKRAANYSRHY